MYSVPRSLSVGTVAFDSRYEAPTNPRQRTAELQRCSDGMPNPPLSEWVNVRNVVWAFRHKSFLTTPGAGFSLSSSCMQT